MEHAHRIRQEFVNDRRYYVLILILMEHAQRDISDFGYVNAVQS